ncbi:MAG TPA: translational GTPase TypA [Deltaproteobacteria bacterium]|nr:translational GTPase TypA [Deltaproteobacteria bacterium]HPR55960.1 translational GTPase TypA [Deltaproteobacteria bacterium]HXK47822.1 translational GTPase TypA [Deltaproteobacteria bacterium]
MHQLKRNESIRNVAIIAHVDHGKTTLVDAMFRQSGVFRAGQEVQVRVMDKLELERERGITIAAKNCSVIWNGVKINIIDTPGHADFGGEVERALSMADGAILLVDASEGPLPQTRFVLKKTLEAGLKVIVVINKIDRKDARPREVLNEIYDLFIDLGADDAQIDFPCLYAVGRDGVAMRSLDGQGTDLSCLFKEILSAIPAPEHDPAEPFQMLVADLDYSDYVGRLAIGRIFHGRVAASDPLLCIDADGQHKPLKVTKLQCYDGVSIRETMAAEPGDIVVLAGIEDVKIGDTICTQENPKALKRITVDEPTVSMRIMPNNSPLAGTEGSLVQSTRIHERLVKETLRNVGIRLETVPGNDGFIIKGRGEFQLAILIETMRREGFELCVSRPEVICEYREGKVLEPIEHLYIDCDEEFLGIVTQKLSIRKGRMINYTGHGAGRVRIEFNIPSRGLIGYRDEFLTDTKGTGIMSSYLLGYEEHRGDFPSRFTGSIVADRRGSAVPYALSNLEPRGRLFVVPGDPVYEGMIVGEHSRENDIDVNPCKMKKLTNMRAAGRDDNIMLSPVIPMTLEKALQFIRDDEMVEVTPKSVRLRKAELSAGRRHDLSIARKKAAG